ncbi:hypothetical protein ACFLY7_00635 [Patescibacteria group bacterium]
MKSHCFVCINCGTENDIVLVSDVEYFCSNCKKKIKIPTFGLGVFESFSEQRKKDRGRIS